jgi:hypothetical protein
VNRLRQRGSIINDKMPNIAKNPIPSAIAPDCGSFISFISEGVLPA